VVVRGAYSFRGKVKQTGEGIAGNAHEFTDDQHSDRHDGLAAAVTPGA
jgi:hypothetical protein